MPCDAKCGQQAAMCSFALLVVVGMIMSAATSLITLSAADITLDSTFDGTLGDFTEAELQEIDVENWKGDIPDNIFEGELAEGQEVPEGEITVDEANAELRQEIRADVDRLEDIQQLHHDKQIADATAKGEVLAESDVKSMAAGDKVTATDALGEEYTYTVTDADVKLITNIDLLQTDETTLRAAKNAEGIQVDLDDLQKFETIKGATNVEGDVVFQTKTDPVLLASGTAMAGIGLMGMGAISVFKWDKTNTATGNIGLTVIATLAFALFMISMCASMPGLVYAGSALAGLTFLGASFHALADTDKDIKWRAGGKRRLTTAPAANAAATNCRHLTPSEAVLQRVNGSHRRRLAPLESLLELIEASQQASIQKLADQIINSH